MAERIEIADFSLDLQGVLQETAAYRKEIDKLKKELRDMKKSEDVSSEALVNQETKIKSLNEEYQKRLKVLQNDRDSNQQSIKRTDQLNAALDQQSNSLRELRANNAALNKLKLDAPLGSEELTKINAKLDENNEKINDNSDAYTQQKINIGNYTQSIEQAIPGVSQLMAVLTGMKEGLIAQTAALKASTAGMSGMTKAAKVLRIALISTGIGAIAVAIGLVVNAMSRSEDATNKLSKAFSKLTAPVNYLLKALEPLGLFLIDGIVAGFNAAAEAADKAIGWISDGLEALGFDSAAKNVRDFQQGMEESTRAAGELADAEARLQKEQRKARLTQLEYQKQAEELRQIRDDEALSIQERVKANEELGKVLDKQLKEELAIAQQALDIANQRIAIDGENTTNLDARAEALTEIADIEERITSQQSEQKANLNTLRREQQAAADEQKKAAEDAAKARAEEAKKASEERLNLMEIELETFRVKNRERLQLSKEANRQIYEDELAILNARAEQEKWSIEQLNLEKLKLKQEYDDTIAEIDAARREEARLQELSIEEFEFSQKIERMKLRKESEFAIEREIQARQFQQRQNDLDTQLANEEISWGEYTRQVVMLENQRADAMKKIKEAEKQANINAAAQTIDAVASVVDQASAAGKSISLAKAGFAVYEAIAKANTAGFPANIPLIAQASAIGFKAIKDIASVDIPSAKGSGNVGGGGSGQGRGARSYARSSGMRQNSQMETNPTTQREVRNNLNSSDMEEKMIKAVSKGASEGTSKGMVELSDNKKIQAQNTF